MCSEYIEDVIVFGKDATYVIQAKYYPGSGIVKNEIRRELYYQYLRLQLLGYEKIKPVLAAYYPHKMSKPSENKMWSYIKDEDQAIKPNKEDKTIVENSKDIEAW